MFLRPSLVLSSELAGGLATAEEATGNVEVMLSQSGPRRLPTPSQLASIVRVGVDVRVRMLLSTPFLTPEMST
jgi:hypothetical protein